MKSFTPRRLNIFLFRVSWVVGLILTQLLFGSVCAQSSSWPRSGVSIGPQGSELQGLTNLCNPHCVTDDPALSLANWLSNNDSASAERTVRRVVVDIDHDGDPDLVAVTNLPRLLIWVNDGRGRFTCWDSSVALRSSRTIEDAADSNDEDTPLLFLWLEARPLNFQLIPLASTQPDLKSGPLFFNSLSQSSPRAPPLRLS